jgi:hypothetical protein
MKVDKTDYEKRVAGWLSHVKNNQVISLDHRLTNATEQLGMPTGINTSESNRRIVLWAKYPQLHPTLGSRLRLRRNFDAVLKWTTRWELERRIFLMVRVMKLFGCLSL